MMWSGIFPLGELIFPNWTNNKQALSDMLAIQSNTPERTHKQSIAMEIKFRGYALGLLNRLSRLPEVEIEFVFVVVVGFPHL